MKNQSKHPTFHILHWPLFTEHTTIPLTFVTFHFLVPALKSYLILALNTWVFLILHLSTIPLEACAPSDARLSLFWKQSIGRTAIVHMLTRVNFGGLYQFVEYVASGTEIQRDLGHFQKSSRHLFINKKYCISFVIVCSDYIYKCILFILEFFNAYIGYTLLCCIRVHYILWYYLTCLSSSC